MSCFVIAEAGVNHNGSEELARQLIDAAVAAKADAVKFQTFKAEKLVSLNAEKAEYQKKNTGEGNQYKMLHDLELSDEAHIRLAKYCESNGIEFMSTAFDEESADFLVSLGIKHIKVPSGELTNLPFIRYLAEKNLPIILSTGMATIDEVKEAVNVIAKVHEDFDQKPLSEWLCILHCTSNYPAEYQEVNLRAMQTLAKELALPVGYSDHTSGILVAPMAVALGAKVIEKHFTLDPSMNGPDHGASLSPVELKELVKNIRDAEQALGSPEKMPTSVEIEVRKVARRSVTLRHDLSKGESLSEKDIVLLRPGTGIAPRHFNEVLGRTLVRDLKSGHTLQWADLEA